MKEYIERNFALYAVKHFGGMLTWCKEDVVSEIIRVLNNTPTADVVEVVRCKDCKHSGMYCFGNSKEETLACLETEEDGFIRFATAVKADDYCSGGERKMDKEE